MVDTSGDSRCSTNTKLAVGQVYPLPSVRDYHTGLRPHACFPSRNATTRLQEGYRTGCSEVYPFQPSIAFLEDGNIFAIIENIVRLLLKKAPNRSIDTELVNIGRTMELTWLEIVESLRDGQDRKMSWSFEYGKVI